MRKISSLFLFAVLILGMTTYPSFNYNSDNLASESVFLLAFAQSNSEDDDIREDDRDDALDAIEDAQNEIERAELKITEAENDGIEVILAKEKLAESKSLLDKAIQNFDSENYDQAEDLAEDAEDLASESRMKYLGKTSEDFDDEIEIKIEIENGDAKVKVEINDEKTELFFEDFSESDIIESVIDLTDLTEDEIRTIWKFEFEDEDKLDDDEKLTRSEKLAEKQARLEAKQLERIEKQEKKLAEREDKLAEKEHKALERAKQLIERLESKIQKLEDRLQRLMEKLDSGEYYGNIREKDVEPKSFTLTFNGLASKISDLSNELTADGEIFLTTQVTKEVKKLRVDSGEIIIGEEIYDVVFGKARSSSSGPGGEKDSLVIIAQTSNLETEELRTIKLTILMDSPISSDLEEPLAFLISSPQSKIANEWFLSGEGNLVQNS